MCQPAPHEPQSLLGRPLPHVRHFAQTVDAPDLTHAIRDLVTQQPPHHLLLRVITRRQHKQIGLLNRPILQQRAFRHETLDPIELQQPDLAIDQQPRATRVQVIPPAAAPVFHLMAGVVLANVPFVTNGSQPLDHGFVGFHHPLHPGLIAADHQRIGRGRANQIAVLQRRAFLVQRVIHLGAGFDADDGGRAALDNRGVHAMAVQVLRHVVSGVSGPQHEGFLARPRGAAFEAVRVKHVAGEIFKPGQVRHMGDAIGAIGQDDMPRVHYPLGPVGSAQAGGPTPLGLVIGAANEFRARPAIELHRFRVHFQPAPQHVLGDVFRPGRRKRHIGQVIDLGLVMQRQ